MMVKDSAPIQMLKKNLGETAWREKEPLALGYLEERLVDNSLKLTSDAWLGVVGEVMGGVILKLENNSKLTRLIAISLVRY